MGIDAPDIQQVLHWGSPYTIEEYVQESGRGGRNHMPYTATLAYKNHRGVTSSDVIAYAQNTTVCHCQLLYSNFLFHVDTSLHFRTCKCCDTHMIKNNLRTPQLAGFAHQLRCK